LLDLLDLEAVSPATLERVAGAANETVELTGLTPCAQLAAFRMIREWRRIGEERLDRLMSDWLIKLGRDRRATAYPVIGMEKRNGQATGTVRFESAQRYDGRGRRERLHRQRAA
jgi:hypothetical protein